MNFSLINVDDRKVSLDDYPEANAFVIVFTCNHCPYAIAYENRLLELDKELSEKGIPMIAISSNNIQTHPQDSPENMKIRAATKGFTFPYLYDETQEIAHAYNAERTPHVFLIARSGDGFEVLYQGAIDNNANYRQPVPITDTYLADAVEAYLQGNSISPSQTPSVGCTIKWK